MPTRSTLISTGPGLWEARSGSMTTMTQMILQHFSSPSAIHRNVLKDSKTVLRTSIRLIVDLLIKIFF